MGELPGAETIYNSQLETGGLILIRELAEQAYKLKTDNHSLQGKALQRLSTSLQAMNDFLRKSEVEIRKFQLSRIRSLVDNAYKNVPFYHELYGACGYVEGGISSFSDFEQLPIISKDLLNSFDERIRVSEPRAMESADVSRTSGSSGKPFTMYRDPDHIVLHHLQVMRFYNSCLQRPLQASDWIYLIHHAGLAFSSLHGRFRTFQLPDLLPNTPLGKHLRYLRPKLLITLPSYLPIILKHKSEFKMSGVEAILTNSESSTQLERSYYSNALGVPVFDEYSSEELGLIATQCHYGKYHVAEDNVYLEVVNTDERGFGNVICTGLCNELMPLIRYDHGDLAKINTDHQRCECGSVCTSLIEINGRRDDAFHTREHKLVPSASILAAVDDILLAFNEAPEAFRLIQKSGESIDLLTKYKRGVPKNIPEILRLLKSRLSCLFGYPVELLHHEVDALPEQNSYKRRSIVREWKFN